MRGSDAIYPYTKRCRALLKTSRPFGNAYIRIGSRVYSRWATRTYASGHTYVRVSLYIYIWISDGVKYKESIVNFLNTVLMKTFLNYLFVLCPSIVIYGCSNDDKDMVICPYPSFECENAKGDLIYDTENKQ